jgi:low affinity Fe/Cu permease
MAHPLKALAHTSHDAAAKLALVKRVRAARKRDKSKPSAVHDWFRRFAHATSRAVGSPVSFAAAVLVILVWGASGPLFGFSDTWQLVINTGTTIITFLIQNTQNRDSQAIHLKLDELIRAIDAARNGMVEIEDLPDSELARLEDEMRTLCKDNATPASAAAPP